MLAREIETLEAWVNPVSFSGGHNQILSGASGAPAIDMAADGNMFAAEVSVVDGPASGALIHTSQWSHLVIAFVFSTKVVSYYVNGSLISSSTWSGYNPASGTANTRIGSTSSYSSHFNGSVDEAAIYKVALTAAEVLSHYNAGVVTRPVVRGAAGAVGDGDAAMTFDGLTGLVTTDDAGNAFDFTVQFSVELWVLSSTVPTQFGTVGKYNGTQTGWDLSIVPTSGKSRMTVRGTSNIDSLDVGSNLCDGHWHHLVVTVTNAAILTYIDGALVATTIGTWAPVTNTRPVVIGGRTAAAFPGTLDEIAIYPYALSAAQVLNHHNAGIQKIGALATPSDKEL